MLIQYLCMQASKGLIHFAKPGTDLFVKQTIAGDKTSRYLNPSTVFSVVPSIEIGGKQQWMQEQAEIIIQSF